MVGVTESGLELKSVKVTAEREKWRPVIAESGFGLKSVMWSMAEVAESGFGLKSVMEVKGK